MRLRDILNFFLKKSILLLTMFYFTYANATPLFLQKALEKKETTQDPKVVSMQDYVMIHPDDVKAKIALAETYYKNAQFDVAITTLQDIKSKKLLNGQGQLLLAKCYYILGNFDALALNFPLKATEHLSLTDQEILAIQAESLIFQEQYQAAKEQYHSLLQQNPILSAAWLGLARLSVRNYDFDEAKNHLREARKVAADEAEIAFIEADIYRLSEDLESARTLYEKTLQIKPYHVWARINYASLLLTLKQADLFYQQINWLSEHAPGHPQTQFFQGMKALQAGDFKKGVTILETLLQKFPKHSAGVQLLARAYYDQGDLNQAAALISTYTQSHPEDGAAVVLESVIALKMNEPKKVIHLLSPFVSNHTQNDRILSLLGTAYLLVGNTDQGIALLERAEIANQNKTLGSELKQAQGSEEIFESSKSLLQGVVQKTEDTSIEENLLTAKNYLSQKQYDNAYQLALSLIKKDPNHAVAHDLLGRAYQGLGDFSSAAKQFKQALQLSPSLVESRYHLAILYEEQSEYDLASQQIQLILKQQPDYVPAVLFKAGLLEKQGQLDQAKKVLEQSYILNHQEKETAVALLKLFKSHFPTSLSYELAQKIAVQFNQDVAIQSLAAQIAYDQGDFVSAQQRYTQALALSPNDLEASQGLAQTYIAMGRINQALTVLNKLSDRNVSDKVTVILYADLALKTQDSYQLNHALEKISKFHQKDASVLRKQGDILMALQQQKKALAIYEEAYQLAPDAKMAIFLYQFENPVDLKRALYRLQDWVENNPQDIETQHFLAQQLMSINSDKALQIYQKILSHKSDDLVALNNLALLLSEKNPIRSLSLITQAYKVNKNNPKILDTYGWVLLKNKRRAEALKYLKMAFEKEDKDLEIRWHYAYGLYHNGDIDQAKEVLGKMLNDTVLQSTLSQEAKQFLFELS